jgi:hypothetical protein
VKFCLDFGDDFRQGNGLPRGQSHGKILKSCEIHDRGRLGLSMLPKQIHSSSEKGGPVTSSEGLSFTLPSASNTAS